MYRTNLDEEMDTDQDYKENSQETNSAQNNNGEISGIEDSTEKLSDLESIDIESENKDFKIEDLNKKIAQLKEDNLSSLAELENMRKRFERDRVEAAKYAITRFSSDLLEVFDDLQRGVNAFEKTNDENQELLTGIKMTIKSFEKVFRKNNIKKIESLGCKFDQNLHQAIFTADSSRYPNFKEGDIVEVIKEGFYLNDRLLRCASVGVIGKK